jgi:hypothetical protein
MTIPPGRTRAVLAARLGSVDHSADRWVQRLRDGDVPPTWRIVVVTVLVPLVVGVLRRLRDELDPADVARAS